MHHNNKSSSQEVFNVVVIVAVVAAMVAAVGGHVPATCYQTPATYPAVTQLRTMTSNLYRMLLTGDAAARQYADEVVDKCVELEADILHVTRPASPGQADPAANDNELKQALLHTNELFDSYLMAGQLGNGKIALLAQAQYESHFQMLDLLCCVLSLKYQ